MGVRALWLPDAMRWAGLPVRVLPGWETRGRDFRLLEGVVGHHTGTPDKAAGDYPSERVVRDGRDDLDGPLSNLGLSRSGVAIVVAAGVANHAGVSAFAGYVDLNDEFLGIEAEDNGDGKWPAAQLDAYPRMVAGVLHYLRRGPDRYTSHRTCAKPAGRKPDPAGITDEWMRARAAAVLATGGAPNMPTTADYAAAILSARIGVRGPDGKLTGQETSLELELASIRRRFDELPDRVLDAPIDRTELGLRPTTLRTLAAWADPNTDATRAVVQAAGKLDDAAVAAIVAKATGTRTA